MKPLAPTDPDLRRASEPVTRAELRTKTFQDKLEELLDFVYAGNNKGTERDRTRPSTVGLSAPQIGWNKRVSVVDLAIGQRQIHDIHVLINPEVIKSSESLVSHQEGCVNLSGIWGSVARPRTVIIRTLDRAGNKLTIEATGWAAALLQHEVDHLNGRLFIDHLSDPTQAHLVAPDMQREYNRKSIPTWPHHVDVTHLVRSVFTSATD